MLLPYDFGNKLSEYCFNCCLFVDEFPTGDRDLFKKFVFGDNLFWLFDDGYLILPLLSLWLLGGGCYELKFLKFYIGVVFPSTFSFIINFSVLLIITLGFNCIVFSLFCDDVWYALP